MRNTKIISLVKKLIHRLTLQFSQFPLGLFWIRRIKCGYKFDFNNYVK